MCVKCDVETMEMDSKIETAWKKKFYHTFTSMSPILLAARMIGRPTRDGKICAGKFDPAYPTLTNYPTWQRWVASLLHGRQNNINKYFKRKNNSPLFHYHKLILFFLDYPSQGLLKVDFILVISIREQYDTQFDSALNQNLLPVGARR